MFHNRPMLSPKAMHFSFFVAPGFQFQNHLNFQGLQHFSWNEISVLWELGESILYKSKYHTYWWPFSIEICSNQIHIIQMDWMNIANLRYDGVKLTPRTIPGGVNFDRALTLSTMIREEVQGQNVRNVGSLNMSDKLIHYTWMHMLCLRGNNFSQLLNEDIFMLWCIKNNILIN